MKVAIFDFEKPIYDLEQKIEEFRAMEQSMDMREEIQMLQQKLTDLKKKIYGNLSAWQSVQISRHPNRPYFLDYISGFGANFTELHGDRRFADDKALCAGLAQWNGQYVMMIGHQKGRELKERQMRNFGCAHPEGYRKALRIMKLAEKMNIPIICMIDTPGAYPGIGAEERGQAEAIAVNLEEMMLINVPIIVIVIGEGGSGGALGVGVGDRVLMLENAYYSVISPEGCASILWRDKAKTPQAAEALRLTSRELQKLGIIDRIVPEPLGGAHKNTEMMIQKTSDILWEELLQIKNCDRQSLLKMRYERFRKIGVFASTPLAVPSDLPGPL